jgi:hypothetical protein
MFICHWLLPCVNGFPYSHAPGEGHGGSALVIAHLDSAMASQACVKLTVVEPQDHG